MNISRLYRGGVSLPNVSYCKNENEVHYNPLIIQPNNEIWYTSTDGNIVDLYTLYCYSDINYSIKCNVLSNTYENGKGIIKFSGPLVTLSGSDAIFANRNNTVIYVKIPEGCCIINPRYNLGIGHGDDKVTIVLPSTITTIDSDGTNLIDNGDIYFYSPTPPLEPTSFMNNNSDKLNIYVPTNLVETYKSADEWSAFASKIQAIPE